MRPIGENIKRERVTWGMSQAELAERLGLPRDVVTKIEIGVRKATIDELVAMAQLFQVSVDELAQGPKQVVYDRIEPGGRRWRRRASGSTDASRTPCSSGGSVVASTGGSPGMPARWPEVEKAQALRQEHGLGDAYVDVFDVLRRMDIEVTAGLSRTALWKARYHP